MASEPVAFEPLCLVESGEFSDDGNGRTLKKSNEKRGCCQKRCVVLSLCLAAGTLLISLYFLNFYIFIDPTPLRNLLSRLETESSFADFAGRGWDGVDLRLMSSNSSAKSRQVKNPYGSRTLDGNFNRTIWSFWDSGEKGAGPLARKCFKRMRDINGPNWEVKVLDTESIKTYLAADELEAFYYMVKNWRGYAHGTDLLRLLLLKKYGGVWIDASSLLTESQEAVLKRRGVIDENDDWKRNPEAEARRRDALVFYNPSMEEEGFETRAPVVENWYIAARRNAPYIDRWLAKSLEFWAFTDDETKSLLHWVFHAGYWTDKRLWKKIFKNHFLRRGFSPGSVFFWSFGPYLTQHWASLWVVQEERAAWIDWFWNRFGEESQNGNTPLPQGRNGVITWKMMREKEAKFTSRDEFEQSLLSKVNPGITLSLRIDVENSKNGPFQLQHHFDWKNGTKWITNWHHKISPPPYLVKFTGTARKSIETALKMDKGIDPNSILGQLLADRELE